MKLSFAVICATCYGLSVRLLYGFLDGIMGIMSLAFLVLVPVLIGYITVIAIPYKSSHTASGAFFKPWLSCLAILIVTIMLGIEGAICWVMIFPFFAILAGLGGIMAHNHQKDKAQPPSDDLDSDEWQKPNKLQISLIVLLPFVAGIAEGGRTLAHEGVTITKQVVINAPPDSAWKQLLNVNEIKTQEHHTSLAGFLGFPHHIKTTLGTTTIGSKRFAFYEKGLTFEETIIQYEPGKLMALKIETDASKISAKVLDEHIVIGGKHVQIDGDTYQLQQLKDGTCALSLTSRFSINTPFNWYAGIWANYLMSGILQDELNIIKSRAVK